MMKLEGTLVVLALFGIAVLLKVCEKVDEAVKLLEARK